MEAYITKLIDELKQFEPHAQALDTVHNNYLTKFQQVASALFTPDANFSGATSDNVAELLGNYLTAASSLSDSMGTGISEMYGKSACSATVAAGQLQDLWNSIKSSWFPEFTLIAAPDEMAGALNGWSSSLYQYAGEAEPLLPANPQTPSYVLPPTTPLTPHQLTPAQQGVVNDAIAILTRDGIYFDQSEIEALARAGYDANAIVAIIKLGTISDSMGKAVYATNGHPYFAHGWQHIALRPADMIATTQKSNRNQGKGRETTFYGNASAQDAINWAIAGDPAAQDFINAAVPNTQMQITRCASAAEHKDWGFGYERQPAARDGSYPPPILHEHLNCVTVWIAVDSSGEPFIVDAFPTW